MAVNIAFFHHFRLAKAISFKYQGMTYQGMTLGLTPATSIFKPDDVLAEAEESNSESGHDGR
ncbi:hypothetical protein WG66_011267 [Moniliophthora roreri]|nr:hypothetical protein WG66_011267 [Moniliophthora roreri]